MTIEPRPPCLRALTRRQLAACATAALLAAPVAPARAQTAIKLGYTPVAVFASAFVAKEEGYFAKRGLDVSLVLLPSSSTIPSAVMSGSVQVGAPTPSVMLQAVDGGLDVVALANAAVSPPDDGESALLVRADSPIKDARELAGKRVGVPGLNALLHVLLRRWMLDNGVDHRQVTFIEAPLPQMGDLLRGGSVDAVISAGPLKDNIIRGGVGRLLLPFGRGVPPGQTFGVYMATREWAQKNAATAKAFAEAIAEGAAYTRANTEAARAHIGKYVRVPPPVLAAMNITPSDAVLTPAQLTWWIDEMRRQDMLRTAIDPARLIFR